MRRAGCAIVWAWWCATVTAAEPAPATPPPSPENPVGWRRDGTGRYPDVDPPITWARARRDAGAYETKGITWMTPMPAGGVSCPIVVGDHIYLTTEVCDLVCLDAKDGRLLWIRSSPEFEAVPADERAATPAYAEKLEPLAKELAAVNDDLVVALNARRATAPSAAPVPPEALVKRKRAIEKQINDAQSAIDKKKFARYWGQAVFGFSGPTPVSDGGNVCAFFTTGVTASFTADGRRRWIARGAGGGSEHGNFASPVICDGRVCVWANEMRAYDVETGALAWSVPAKAFNTYGSMFRVRAGADWVACHQWGFFVRVRDGTPVWDKGIFGDSVCTPVVDGRTVYAAVGYPKANDKTKGLRAFTLPADTAGGKLTPGVTYKPEWADDEIPQSKEKAPFDRGYVSSPLVDDGLVYQLTQGGGLTVHDAATGALAYRKVLDLHPRTHYWDWAGCSASPTRAGPYVYIMDNQGTTLVLKPGRAYAEVARNVIEELREGGKDQAQMVSTPVFDGKRMYYRTPGFLYCIEKP
ncbi:MAG: PQQ-binding-like beta-propeller repeat protein [Phycisphaerae bacterium]|nr:PQQ-binding-like beta-propeller repeat protein [Tepidisphaeraceae bacterium]